MEAFIHFGTQTSTSASCPYFHIAWTKLDLLHRELFVFIPLFALHSLTLFILKYLQRSMNF